MGKRGSANQKIIRANRCSLSFQRGANVPIRFGSETVKRDKTNQGQKLILNRKRLCWI